MTVLRFLLLCHLLLLSSSACETLWPVLADICKANRSKSVAELLAESSESWSIVAISSSASSTANGSEKSPPEPEGFGSELVLLGRVSPRRRIVESLPSVFGTTP